ncbi:MAG: Asp-tRNA(Asn)/Glu-tRNA(Gln) amidotransferase GatCAB subunit A [Acidobacteria bacterium]|nr:MAG: Asp-tRNA(Asn)/Glu-tRNA(Gln) amidotransferase GatCAB subunit A [Acidobacteriota bacterium]
MATSMISIEDFGRRLRARELTCEQVTNDCLQCVETDNPRLNAFILIAADEARRQAREADRELAAGRDRGALHGVPIAIKDLLDMRGLPTTAASRVRDGHVADRDAPAIAHLRQAGAVFVGKTNLHEFAFGTTNEDSAFGPTRNPLDPSRSPGGSSGGSAASVATGMALAAVGTDTGGSVRIPAAACGIVGLKPSFGEISCDGVVPLSRTFDHVGPLARNVADASLLYHAMLGDGGATTPAPMPVGGLRLAVPRPYFCDLLDDDVRACFERALERLRTAGARVADSDIHHATDIAAVYMHISFADAAAYHAVTLDTMPERYTEPVRLRLEMARYVLAEDYVRALAGREVLRREVDAALAQHDALLLPTLPIPAPPIGASTVAVGRSTEPVRNMMLRLTQLFNVTGHPVVSVPMGRTPAGLPCGMQLVGCRMQTDTLLRVALACEAHVRGELSSETTHA